MLNGGANTAMAWPTKSKVGLSLWAHRAKVGKGGMQGLDGPLNLLPQKRQYAEQRTLPRLPDTRADPGHSEQEQPEGDKQNSHEVTKPDSLNLKDKRHKVIC